MPEPTIKCKYCGNEYIKRKLRCDKCDKIGIASLYKYVSYNVNSLSILVKRKIWIPKAESLNDPFEFEFKIEEMKYNGISIDEESMSEAKRQMKQMGVLSFSDKNDDILMWCHYSDAHTGFCIEFERNQENDLGNYDSCIPVNYEEDLPQYYSKQLEDKSTIASILTTKSNHWNYENEWRILAQIGNIETELPGRITGIVFGQRMTLEQKETIRSILKDEVSYYYTKNDDKKYSLEVIRIL
jgi:hypothetical protein